MRLHITRVHSHRFVIFVLTFFCYAMFHANRHAFSNVKTSTEKIWTPTVHNASLPALKPDHLWNSHDLFDNLKSAERFQGVLDTTFMVSYATGLFLNGYIGDRVNMRILLTIGTAGTSLTNFIFGCVCEWTTFYNKYFYIFIWIVNGLMQSTGWPVVVACMGNWFGKSGRGVLLGIWSSCASVGNILGALMVASVLSYGYQYTFLLTSSVSLAAAIFVFVGLIPTPVDVGLEVPQEDDEYSQDGQSGTDTTSVELKVPQLDYDISKEDLSKEDFSKENLSKEDLSKEDLSKEDLSKEDLNKEDLSKEELSKEDLIKEDLSKEYISKDDLSKEDLSKDDVGKEHVTLDTNDKVQNDVKHDEACEEKIDYDIKTTQPASMPFWKAILLPGVIAYSLAYAFLKLVNYSFFFWLPFYLNNALHFVENEAAKLSTVYDVAGIVGGIVVGFASDRVGKRTVLIVPMLLLSIPSLFIYSHSPDNLVANIALMFLVGFFIAGVANLISAAVSADLGCQKQLRGDDKALATVTGVIDGTGSFGAALGQIAVPYLQTSYDWHSVFYLFMICMFMTSVCLMPVFIREFRSLRCCSCFSKKRRYSIHNSVHGNSII